jgi:hypothetical protein
MSVLGRFTGAIVRRGAGLLRRKAADAATSAVRREAVPKTAGLSKTALYKRSKEFTRNADGLAEGMRGKYRSAGDELLTSETPGPVDYKAPISDRKSGYFTTKEGGVRTGSFGNRTSGSTTPAPTTSTRPTRPPRPAPAGYKSTGTKAPESVGRGPVANDAPLGSRGGPSFGADGRVPDLGGSFKTAKEKAARSNAVQSKLTLRRDIARNDAQFKKRLGIAAGLGAAGIAGSTASLIGLAAENRRTEQQRNQPSTQTYQQGADKLAAQSSATATGAVPGSSESSASTDTSPITRSNSTTGVGGVLQDDMRASAAAVRPDRDYMGEAFDATLRKGVTSGRAYLKGQLARDKADVNKTKTTLAAYDKRVGKDTLLGRDRGVGYLKNADSDQTQKDLLAAYRGRFGNYRKNARASEIEAMAQAAAAKRGS